MLNSYKLFALFTLVYFSLFFVFNVKTYLLVFIFAFLLLFLYFKYNLTKTIFILLLLSLPFENNLREWVIQVTPPLYLGVPTSGYNYFFGINLKIIFGLFSFLLLIKNKTTTKDLFSQDRPIIIFFALSVINTFYFFSSVSVMGLARLWLSLFIYFSAKIIFKTDSNLFPIFICSIFVFSTFIGLNQFIRQKPLGKFIELTPSYSQTEGITTTDGQVQYRLSGFISHPVYFGSFMSILLPIFIGFSATVNPILSTIFTLLGAIVMLGTHSRTVWINIGLTIFLLFPYLKQFKKSISQKNITIFATILIIVCIIIIISRIQSITQIFSANGNGSIRLQLIAQSFQILANHPFGVSLNQYTNALIELPTPPNITGFIVPVHNTFLLITTELGIIAGSIFIYFVVKSVFNKSPKTLLQYGTIIGAISFIISSQFHPLFNLDPTFDLFMLTLGYINSQWPPSKI